VTPLNQLCQARDPVEVFVRLSIGVRCSKRKSILHTDNLSLFW